MAEYVGVNHAVVTSSGSTALDLAMNCIGVKSGDEAIVPDFTFQATANSVIHSGGAPVFVDIGQSGFKVSCVVWASLVDDLFQLAASCFNVDG